MPYAIETTGLTKNFASTRALDGVDLRSEPGLSEFLDDKVDAETLRTQPGWSRQLLMTFRENS